MADPFPMASFSGAGVGKLLKRPGGELPIHHVDALCFPRLRSSFLRKQDSTTLYHREPCKAAAMSLHCINPLLASAPCIS